MNRDDIIRMAREVGAGEPQSLYGRTDYIVMTAHDLERFAALVAAHERDACALICENIEDYDETIDDIYYSNHYANAIRARSKA